MLTRRYGLPKHQLQLPTPPPPQVPLMYAVEEGAGHLLVPRLAAALSPGGFPTAALGRKGPSLTGGEVTLPCRAYTKAPPQAPHRPCWQLPLCPQLSA